MTEEQAIDKLKQGDISGLEVLVKTYYLQAARAAYLVTQDRLLAEDVVQAAFLQAYERIGQFERGRPFAPWFLRSVINRAIKAAGREAGQTSLEPDDPDEVTLPAQFLADPGPGPEDLAEATELRARVWQALGKLSPRQRAAIVQRYYLGLSEAEMAEELAISPGSIKRHLHSARKQLRSLLQPLWATLSKTERSL